MAVLFVGLQHWVQQNGVPQGTARASGGTMCRFMALGAAE